MFSQTNTAGDLSGLDDFIEKPLEKCSSDEITAAVARLAVILEKNPGAILPILGDHPFIPATFLLDDLIKKMAARNSREKVNFLFDKHLSEVVNICIYNSHDLERCTRNMPEYTTKVIEHILNDNEKLKFILLADSDTPATLTKLNTTYRQFETQFTARCQELFTPPAHRNSPVPGS